MNWIYTWHNPRVDADAAAIAREMGDIFLRGVMARRQENVRIEHCFRPWRTRQVRPYTNIEKE